MKQVKKLIFILIVLWFRDFTDHKGLFLVTQVYWDINVVPAALTPTVAA